MGFIWNLGRDKERKVIELFLKHMQTSHEEMERFTLLMNNVCAGKFSDVEKMVQDVKDHEHDCDRLRHEIITHLFEGAFLPVMRGQLYRLSDMVDDVSDTIDNAAHMVPYLKIHKPTKELSAILSRLTSEANKSVTMLELVMRSMLDKESDDLFKEKYQKMKVAEEGCDHIQKELFDALYSNKKLNPTLVLLVGHLGHTISNIADNVEQSCDVMSSIKMLRHA